MIYNNTIETLSNVVFEKFNIIYICIITRMPQINRSTEQVFGPSINLSIVQLRLAKFQTLGQTCLFHPE